MPLLLAIATSCNIGSAATIFGNPQNAFIASSAGVSLLDALVTLLPSAAVGLALNIVMLYAFYVLNLYWHKYRERCYHNHSNDTVASPVVGVTNSGHVDEVELKSFTTLQQAHRRLYLPPISASYPNLTQATDEQDNDQRYHELRETRRASPTAVGQNINPSTTQLAENVSRWAKIKKILFISWLIFITLLVVVLLAIPDCPGNKNLMFNLGLVPVAAGILTMMVVLHSMAIMLAWLLVTLTGH